MRSVSLAALACVLALGSWAADARYAAYESPRRTFACDVPVSWKGFEEDTPSGSAAHFLGPAEADGAWRAALHVHFMETGKPGFVPIEAAIKRAQRPEKATSRQATALTRRRLRGRAARRFEATETRLLPRGRVPSRPVLLHHYYAFLPAGDGYFLIDLSSTRETYQRHRDAFERALDTFRVPGHP